MTCGEDNNDTEKHCNIPAMLKFLSDSRLSVRVIDFTTRLLLSRVAAFPDNPFFMCISSLIISSMNSPIDKGLANKEQFQ
jgi:hypothetical protein